MVLDVLIGILLVTAFFVGYQRGLIQPLMVEVFFVGALLLLIRERAAYTSSMDRIFHINPVLDIVVALGLAVLAGYAGAVVGASIHKLPLVRGVDGLLGVFVHVGVAVLVAYLLISALVTMDRAFTAALPLPSLNAGQVAALKKEINSNALTASLVDSRDLDKLQAQARTPGGARIATVSQLNQLATVYVDFVQPQLKSSRLAPVITGLGRRVPLVGKVGPSDLPGHSPTPNSRPATTPKPTPKPTR